MTKRQKSQPTRPEEPPESNRWRNVILIFCAFGFILAVALTLTAYGPAPNQPPPSDNTTDMPTPTVNPTLMVKMADWAKQSMRYSCVGGERIVYLGIITPIADQRAGATIWHNIPAGATMDDVLNFNPSAVVKNEIRKIDDPGQYRAMILAVLVNYTISDWNLIDWIHEKQLRGYVEALCWSFRNQTLLTQTWHLDANQQEIVLDGLAFIYAIQGNNADETLALYKSFNVELNPTTLKSAHWLQKPWTQRDNVSCEMLDFINWLSQRGSKGIAFSAGEPPRSLIRAGALPFQQMKAHCTPGIPS